MKTFIFLIMTLFFLSGCTQLVTAPLSIATSVATTSVSVAGSAVSGTADLVAGDDEE